MTEVIPVPARVAMVIFGALLLQLSVVNRLAVGGVTGDLLVVVVVAGGFLAGPERGGVIGFAVGLSIDLFLTTPLGLTALVFTAVGYVAGMIAAGMIRSSRLMVVVLATAAAPAAMLSWVVVGALFGQTHLINAPLVRVALVGMVVAFVTIWLVLPVMRWATAEPHVRMRAA